MIIFCDKNKELVEEVKKIIRTTKDNNLHTKIKVFNGDVLDIKKKYPTAKIVTASNPVLDASIKKAYPEQCVNPREFLLTDDLFFVISVGYDLEVSDYWLKRAFFGIYMISRKYDVIFTGLGTGVGVLSIEEFIGYLEKFIKADFNNSDFSNLNFSNFNFSYSNFSNSNFSNSNFSYSDFSNSKFSYSDFSNSDFSYSDFSNSDFSYSYFDHSDFRGSNFSNSKFRGSIFSYSDFKRSNFKGSDFTDSKFNYRIIPEEGSFIGWKKADHKIIKLEIDAKNAIGGFIGRKCRCKKAKVLEIQDLEGNKLGIKKIRSDYDENFVYEVGKTIIVEDYDDNPRTECSKGIHFFVTRQEAVDY